MNKDNIFTILTTEDKNEIKDAIKILCMEQIRKDIESTYLIDAGDIRNIHQKILEEITDEIKKEIKEEYGEIIKQKILASI
ncbi:MAG: hypothetical protein GY870_09185 [archaeon]|nr:hypothetical protein [archaeon]